MVSIRTIWKRPAWWVCLTALIVSVACFVQGQSLRNDFFACVAARPVDIPIDASQPGEYVMPYTHACPSPHGESIGLRVSREVVGEVSPAALLEPLRCEAALHDARGVCIQEVLFEGVFREMYPYEADEFPIFYFWPVPEGDYTVKLRITEGIPALSGVTAHVYLAYTLCGLELLPAAALRGLGGLALLVAVLAAFGLWRKKLAVREDTADTEAA